MGRDKPGQWRSGLLLLLNTGGAVAVSMEACWRGEWRLKLKVWVWDNNKDKAIRNHIQSSQELRGPLLHRTLTQAQ